MQPIFQKIVNVISLLKFYYTYFIEDGLSEVKQEFFLK